MQATGGTTLNADKAPRFAARAVAVLGATALLALALDQWVKYLSTEHLDPNEPVRILGGLIYLSLLRNSGAAFSFGDTHTWIFPVITLVVIGWIGWMATRLRSVPWALALGLVLGGALGNLADRLFRAPGPFQGKVVDMISVFAPYAEKFPVFNIADSCLTVGVCLAVLLELTGRQRDGSRLKNTKNEQVETEETA
ncbi:peptidase A8 [Actinoplanes sp. SE50]|uniref:signal peptidase II n=1 Tax=unclassified Actinoplanes TaxID=2626549 RepID=UPI00023ECC54|nr:MULTISPECIES: signal peptidase II [unclassified Actinoplanes]AEV82669.1 signal peptidase II [Actinoplanes sp. SE50/110]ATO81065.1 peptidase A8 [Actinoplanes sp. SE50]SLL98472.1 signal peptidase II [Actinoplanes sp. SE50/110]